MYAKFRGENCLSRRAYMSIPINAQKKIFLYQDITNVKAQKKGNLEYYYFYSKNKILFKVSMSSCNANLLRKLVDRKKWKNKSHN